MPSGTDAAWVGLAWWLGAWLGGGLLTLPLEGLVMPHRGRWTRPASAWRVQFGLWTVAFSTLLLLTWRPGFAATLALAGALLVVVVNNAKFRALNEPFLFSDFGLFSQALRHPRLYLPFLGFGRAAAAAAAFTGSLYLGLSLEPALSATAGWPLALGATMTGLMIGVALLWHDRQPAPSLDPATDLRELGLATALWRYWRLERARIAIPDDPPGRLARLQPRLRRGADPLPHIVAVQSESFFDARRLPAAIAPAILAGFDRATATALAHGRLQVPAWGANTMRTEFGFLTGIDAASLGVHRFNPYRLYARRPVVSLASLLRDLGYRTLCIHPHPVDFFARDRVYPQLGFDGFVDIRAFDRTETCGPYICDAAVGRKIGELLDAATRPTFVFAITMENHGPLHLERVTDEDRRKLYTAAPPAGFDDLTVYLRHLVNADRMLDGLTRTLAAQPRDSLLCWFGDHVPSMPQVYAATGHTDGRTDYLVWRPRSDTPSTPRDLPVERLGEVLLAAAGLIEPQLP